MCVLSCAVAHALFRKHVLFSPRESSNEVAQRSSQQAYIVLSFIPMRKDLRSNFVIFAALSVKELDSTKQG